MFSSLTKTELLREICKLLKYSQWYLLEIKDKKTNKTKQNTNKKVKLKKGNKTDSEKLM